MFLYLSTTIPTGGLPFPNRRGVSYPREHCQMSCQEIRRPVGSESDPSKEDPDYSLEVTTMETRVFLLLGTED